jgi:Domain of unknown function (DUF4329)
MALRLCMTIGMLAITASLQANVVPHAVHGECGPIKTALHRERDFPTVVATVGAMARAHLDTSLRSDREFVGAVLQDQGGRFRATVGAGCPGQDTVTFSVAVPVGSRLAAFWHTHGAAGPLRELFSPDDAQLVLSTGYDFYLVTPDGELRVLRRNDVGKRTVRGPLRDLRSGIPRGASAGRRLVMPGQRDELASERCADTSQTAPV